MVAIGWLLGGVVGIGTVLYALAIGPLVQVLLPHFIVDLPGRRDGGRKSCSMLAADAASSYFDRWRPCR